MPKYYAWKSASGKRGLSTEGGVARLLRMGTRFVELGRPIVDLGAKAARIAASQLGVVEVPKNSNTGAQVKRYQAATNVGGTGWAWCLAFALWVWDRAGIAHVGYQGGYCPHFELWARKAGRWHSRPKVGAIALLGWGRSGVADHAAIVEKSSPLVLVEGNAQPGPGGDQSNGGGVYRRTDRTPAVIRGYVY